MIRRRRLRRSAGTGLVAFAAALLLLQLPVRAAAAQSIGGLFLLVPFGARAVGRAEAVVADSALGSEAVWWNAAALARLPKQEIALHHSHTVFADSDMLVYARPSRVLGTLALSAYMVNYGDQEATDSITGGTVGNITNRNYLLGVSYATPVGKRFNAGISYKLVMLRFSCSGLCGAVSVLSGTTSALDVGAQYALPAPFPISFGASVRNIGPALQIKDQPQADPLPRIVQVGTTIRIPWKSLAAAGGTVDVSADVLHATGILSSSQAVGAVLGYRDQVFISGGFKREPNSEGDGASLGIGLQRGDFAVDIGRRFDSLSSQLGDPSMYVSLRARF